MKNFIKTYNLCLFLIIIMINFNTYYPYADSGMHIWTKSSVLIEAETGKVLAENNGNKVIPPASLSKIMTFLLALESIEDGKVSLNDKIVVSKDAAKIGSSTYRLREGEVVDLRELLESMMIVSSNASAVAIGEHISGNIDDFIVLMNKRGKEIGMTNTNFINPHGLPIYKSDTVSISNLSTAKDLATLSRYLLLNFEKEALDITSRKVFFSRFKSYQGTNTNPVLSEVQGVDGLKTGYTGAAGYCLAFTKKIRVNDNNIEDMRIIGIVLGAGNSRDREKGTKALLEYGTENFFKKTIINKGDYVGETFLYGRKELPIKFVAGKSITLIKQGEAPSQIIKKKEIILEELESPVIQGKKIGELRYRLYDDSIVSTDLISDSDIEKIPFSLLIKIWWNNLTT